MPSQWPSAPECNYIGVFRDNGLLHLGFPFREWSLCQDKWLAMRFVDEVIYYTKYEDLVALIEMKMGDEIRGFCTNCKHVATKLVEAADISKEAIHEHALRWGPCGSDEGRLLVCPKPINDGRRSYRLRKEKSVAGNEVNNSKTYKFGYFAKAK